MRQPPRANDYRDCWCGDLLPADAGRRLRVAGWVHRRRDHGGLVFIDLRDRSGLLQLVFHPESRAAHELAHTLRPEHVISAAGTLRERDQENVNPEMATGALELDVSELQVLARARTPPFAIDEEQPIDELTRLRYRPLDLRRAPAARRLALRHELIALIRRLLHERDFLEVETPLLTRSTPEGARDFLVPSRLARGSFYALPQSPQLFKQLLMVGGIERYFQIARCFRDEDLRADRQPEFTQLDLEMAFVAEEDVIEVIEAVMAPVLELGGVAVAPPPWPRLTHAEALARYGSDRPDLRYGMEIADVSQLVAASEFRVFTAALQSGGVVRAINVGQRQLSRSALEGLNDVVAGSGAKAVAPIYVGAEGGAWTGNLARFFSADQVAAVNDALSARAGDLLLFVADEAAAAAAALAVLRAHFAEHFSLIDADAHAITWVTGFPMFEWSESDRRWVSLHHPFTAPALEAHERALLREDPASVRSRAYDLVLDGVEIGGGSIRINDAQLQREVFAAIGIDEREAEERFGFLLEALAYGAPPHGGIALGIDRIVAICSGSESIREVIAFPKTASGLDPLTGAPAPVDAAQLRELGLRQAGA